MAVYSIICYYSNMVIIKYTRTNVLKYYVKWIMSIS